MRHVLITLLFMASQAHAENWQQIANLDSTGGVLLVDTTSIDRENEIRNAWLKSLYTADRPIPDSYRDVAPGARSYRWELSLGHFNCAERTAAVSQLILYSADGQVVAKLVDPGAPKFHEVAPQSIGGLMVQAVCASSSTPDAQATTGLVRITSIANPDDYYPSGSRRRGEQGAPIVRVCVGPSGALLREPEITDTSGFPDLDGAAIKVAKANRYAPAVRGAAAPPESCIKFKVKFARFNH
jgi:TonB family protein